uniref:AAA+ ATPase domain-containing protein n=1 Tax=Aureoumbra lagunensis TaxID=44058 RepID=A0A7S3JZG1_9STRA
MNVSVGSFWMIMGGNKSAHNVSDMVEKAAKRAQTPNIKRTVKYFDGCNQAQCAENLSLEIVQWLISRDKKYGVAILRKADETALWLLKAIATYWWGQRRCRHPLLLPDAVDCERVAWFLSTQFASEHVLRLENTLTAKNTPLELNRAVAQAARDEWSGALGNRAARRALFVRGQVSVENKIQLFEYFLQKQKEENTTHKHKLGARFVGQTGAIAEVATYLERIGERRSRKTPTVFYFYGVAGSGKSRLAELIAENLHRPLVRLEMESYNTEIDVNRLFGAPAAYEQGGVSLVDELLLHPNAVVLMDEIDKAHVSIFREKLHTALSAGVMTHKQDLNRSADVSNVIFIFTTNCFENQVQSIFSQLIHNASIIHGGKDIDDSVLYSTARTALEILINDAPRIPCSSSKPNPFEDGSLRSRIPRTKQFPFLPLRKHELQSLVVIEFKRLAQELDLNLTWSPKLPATFLDLFPHFTDARVLVERINDDFDHAILNINAHHSNKAIITLADDGHLKFLWIFSSEDDDALIPYEHNTIPSLSSKETSCAQSTAQKNCHQSCP